jgi:hypothetical protein
MYVNPNKEPAVQLSNGLNKSLDICFCLYKFALSQIILTCDNNKSYTLLSYNKDASSGRCPFGFTTVINLYDVVLYQKHILATNRKVLLHLLSAVIYVCSWYRFYLCFYGFPIGFWNCPDSVVFLFPM